MALTIPTNFKNDIQSNHTNLIPLVVIQNEDVDNDPVIYLSTNSGNILTGLGKSFKPLLLNVPSLKESIDLETRKYKINSVTLDFSNVKYEGKKLSDEIAEKFGSLMNTEVRIFWASPSTTNLTFFDTWSEPYDPTNTNHEYWHSYRAFQVYIGTVRRYSHTDDKVKIELEDRSQVYLHKDLPIANLGTAEDVPDKYKNKPIPLVYGHVDKSPCVMKVKPVVDNPTFLESGSIIADVFVNGFIETQSELVSGQIIDSTGALYFGDNGYAPFPKIFNYSITSPLNNIHFQAVTSANPNYSYEIANGKIIFNLNADNDVKKGIVRGIVERLPINVSIDSNELNTIQGNVNGGAFTAIKDYDAGWSFNNYCFATSATTWSGEPISDNWLADEIPQNSLEALNRIINTNLDEGLHIRGFCKDNLTEYHSVKIQLLPSNCDFESESYFIGAYFSRYGLAYIGGTGAHLETKYLNFVHGVKTWVGDKRLTSLFYDDWVEGTQGWFSNTTLGGDSEGGNIFTKIIDYGNTPSSTIDFNLGVPRYETSGVTEDCAVAIDVWYANLIHVTYVDKLIDRKYYANVAGRLSSGENDSPTSTAIISNILSDQLGVDGTAINSSSASSFNASMKYAFTVNETVNSKELLENLASASPYIPRFDNMGNFIFDTIPDANPSTVDHTIKQSTVIDFSFKRTKIENVKTKIEVKYKWDYSRKEFLESTVVELGDGENSDLGDEGIDFSSIFNYYKLKPDHSESTLIVNDNRGKFIRDHVTAQHLANFLLDYHMNQHLIFNVKLPLSVGLAIEVGNIIEFDTLLGDIMPFGINYRPSTVFYLNNQLIYSKFIVTKTNKNLNVVSIECEQLHMLMQQDHIYDLEGEYDLDNADTSHQDFTVGCTYSGAENFNQYANIDDGSCIITQTPICAVGENDQITDVYGIDVDGQQHLLGQDNWQPDNPTEHQYHHSTDIDGNTVTYQLTTNDPAQCQWTAIEPEQMGCTVFDSINYNPDATIDDPNNPCIPIVLGCTNNESPLYDSRANTDNGSCYFHPKDTLLTSGINYCFIGGSTFAYSIADVLESANPNSALFDIQNMISGIRSLTVVTCRLKTAGGNSYATQHNRFNLYNNAITPPNQQMWGSSRRCEFAANGSVGVNPFPSWELINGQIIGHDIPAANDDAYRINIPIPQSPFAYGWNIFKHPTGDKDFFMADGTYPREFQNFWIVEMWEGSETTQSIFYKANDSITHDLYLKKSILWSET